MKIKRGRKNWKNYDSSLDATLTAIGWKHGRRF